MMDKTFDALLAEAQAETFEGWEFSHLTGRWWEEPPPWDYRQIVEGQMSHVSTLLDMGTGGGELLAEFSKLPSATWATEAYPPNIQLAKRTLEPLGVRVVAFQDDHNLPLPDRSFELIVNRHESYAPGEVRRLLAPGGRFITQQVGGRDNWDLNEMLGAAIAPEYADWCLEQAAGELRDEGFEMVDQREVFTRTLFYDVGAIVFYLQAIPWQIPDFTVDRYRDALYEVHQRIQRTGKLVTHSHRFLIVSINA